MTRLHIKKVLINHAAIPRLINNRNSSQKCWPVQTAMNAKHGFHEVHTNIMKSKHVYDL